MNSVVTSDRPLPSRSSLPALARAVFNALLAEQTLTRAAIAELTGLSRVTASGVVDQLIKRGFVEQVGALTSSAGGPSSRTYALSPHAAYAVGISIDATEIAIMTTSIAGDVVSQHREPVIEDDAVFPAVERAIRRQLGSLEAPLSKLRHIVIAASGVVDPAAHEMSFAVNQTNWKANLAAQLRASLGCPVGYENDVNLAALAEARRGAGARLHEAGDLVLVWLDEGIACGIIIGGRLFRGASGWAGEIAFLPAEVVGAADFETGTAGTRTTTMQRGMGIRGITALANGHDTDLDALLTFDADCSDPRLEQARTELARRIALAVAEPLFVFDPDLVVLAGRVVAPGGAALLAAVRRELERIGPAPVRLALSETGPDAILIGSMVLALTRARDELFEDVTD
jgi:predicted NBD/HSP70 family sugar kinase